MKVVTTADGSDTLFNEHLNETYHSRKGAMTESRHVFIQEGLDFYFRENNAAKVNILEVGFGTGLNALLTADSGRKVNYYTLETEPLETALVMQMEFGFDEKQHVIFEEIHGANWFKAESSMNAKGIQLSASDFLLFKLHVALQQIEFHADFFDLVYYDAFAPFAQPEMWELEVFERLTPWVKPGGILVTYCAQGQFRRNLASCGWDIMKIPGPPGKREMVRAIRR